MKKIILLSTLSASILFGVDNLVTIIENNSLLKIGKNNIVSHADPKDYINIGANLKSNSLQNFSPYKYTEYEEKYDTSPTVITMIAEKSIQYGSIYSKGFGEKYNINNLATFVKNKNYSVALMTLDLFNKNDLIYARSRLNVITKSDLIPLELYIKDNIEKDKQERYFNRLEFIYDILNYTNTIYNNHVATIKIEPIKPVLLNVTSIVNGKDPLYEYSGNIINRYCDMPNIEKDNDYNGSNIYKTTYNKTLVSSLDISKPIPLIDLYVFKNYSCPSVQNFGFFKMPKVSWNSDLPSATEQKRKLLTQLKTQRNGGTYLSKMQSLYSFLNTDSSIKSALKNLNNRGITYGKVLHVNYGLTEGVTNDKVHLSVIKNITTGSIYNDKINLIMNEGFVYNTNNAPNYFMDKTDFVSELSKEDVSGKEFNTLYYVINQKISPKVPEIDNFHAYSNLIPSASKSDGFIAGLYGSEVMWLTNRSGEYLRDYNYNNQEELLIDPNNEIEEEELINGMKKYLRSRVDIEPNAKEFYPINLKGIIMSYIPSNNESETSIEYFGPRYQMELFYDKFIKKTIVKEPLDCSKESCTEDEKKMENPTKDVEKIEKINYCGVKFDNPDIEKYKYIVFEDIINKIIEEPFGDIQIHAHKNYLEKQTEYFQSEIKVPTVLKYIGEVDSIDECKFKSNIAIEQELKNKLSEDGVLFFNFNKDVDELNEIDMEKFANDSNIMSAYIDEVLSNNTILVRDIKEQEVFIEDSVDYINSKQDTYFNFYNDFKSNNKVDSAIIDGIDTTIIK